MGTQSHPCILQRFHQSWPIRRSALPIDRSIDSIMTASSVASCPIPEAAVSPRVLSSLSIVILAPGGTLFKTQYTSLYTICRGTRSSLELVVAQFGTTWEEFGSRELIRDNRRMTWLVGRTLSLPFHLHSMLRSSEVL